MREGEQLRQSRSNQAERISSILCSICVSVLSVLFIPFLFAALTRVLYSAATRFTRISLKKSYMYKQRNTLGLFPPLQIISS